MKGNRCVDVTEVQAPYASLQSGEWGTHLDKPKALDTDSAEARQTGRLITELGFTRFIVVLRYVLPVAGPTQIVLCNWRPDWYERYWSRGYLRIDPVVARMLTSYRPFDWQDCGPLNLAQREFHADAVRHGMVDGIAGAVRIGSDQAGFFSVSSDRRCSPEAKEHAMGRVFLHVVRLHERVRDQMLDHYRAEPVVLTTRQREALQLTLRGVSRRAASARMGCSESGFVRHQEAARRKLGEATNLDAVRKALAMNLIRPYDTVLEGDSKWGSDEALNLLLKAGPNRDKFGL